MSWKGETTTGSITQNEQWWEDGQCPGCKKVYAIPKRANRAYPDKYYICKPCGYNFRRPTLTGHNPTAIVVDKLDDPAPSSKPPIDWFAINKEFSQ